ncbi:MAG: cysteine desulfurase [Parcubacteria group bacterium Gr01-1014_29]|nr:MAG: cysteine desulfurase [Parcubacteria group bacterium Gr01-1014_29]
MDYAAATPLDKEVRKAMLPFLRTQYGNPSSIHAEGRAADAAIAKARKSIADVLGMRPPEIIFTGSGTESIALAIQGVMNLHHGAHMVTSEAEHSAVLENAAMVEKIGSRVTYIPVTRYGIVDMRLLAKSIQKDTVLISIAYINNEIGAIQPLSEIANIVRKERNRRKVVRELLPLWFHTDACQAGEYAPLRLDALGVDMLTLNASKLYGPKGVGLLCKRTTVGLQPLWGGGGQEQGLRSGTENIAGIVGFAKAVEIADRNKIKERHRMTKLQEYFLRALKQAVPDIELNGPPLGNERSCNNVNIYIPGISGETLVLYFDERGIAASTGSACLSREGGLSRAILSLSQSETRAVQSIRFTLGRYTARSDIDGAVHVLRNARVLLRNAPRQTYAKTKNR